MNEDLLKQIKQILNPILYESGSVFYSSEETLIKGDVYTLGLNPGGIQGKTIFETLQKFRNSRNNSYLDEDWSSEKRTYGIGQHPLQKNLVGLLNSLGYNPRKVFSSNLIFKRSHGQETSNFQELAPMCWKVHEILLNIIDPKFLIIFGNSSFSPYYFIKRKYLMFEELEFPAGHNNWQIRISSGVIENSRRILIGLPHLSRYCIINHNDIIIRIMDLIKKCEF